MYFNNVKIKGVGSYLPKKIITNHNIAENADTTDEWIYKSLGIKERRSVETETVSDLGVEASLRALDNAGIDKEDLDLIVVATSSPERISPSTACTIHKKLGIKKEVPSFDINAVCAGFVFSVGITAPLISSGMYRNILVVGSETYSNIIDYSHRDSIFFGDGAGAIILGQSEKGWIFTEIKSDGSGTGFSGFNCGLNTKYKTTPREVREQALKVLPDSIRSVLSKTNTSIDDISIFIPHQASINVLKEIAVEVGLPVDKIKAVMEKYGNIAGASIPIALDDAFKNGEVKDGDKLLLTAIGSGWSWGSLLINHE
jgi:3-oxoacyl-[acyl-carrier-protein] synthase-3